MELSAAPDLTPPGSWVSDATAQTFKALVIDASREAVVLVDFWAEWCGPCKQLTPLLEKLVQSHKGRVRLVKIDVDKNQQLAAQFRVQSIPTVLAYVQGRPADGFQGALPESQLKQFVEGLLRLLGPDTSQAALDLAALIEAAEAALADGAAEDAAGLFSQALEAEPESLDALGGLARALLALGAAEEAAAVLAQAPADKANHPAVARAAAALALAADAAPVDDLAGLRAAVEADPKDKEKRFELAGGLLAAGDRDGAADHLLTIISQDRNWNDGAARAQLLKMFEAAGVDDPFTVANRRRLSSILFA